MTKHSDYINQIDKYLNAELSETELSEFELRLESDMELLCELNLHQDIEQALNEHDVNNLRKNMNQIIQNNNSQNDDASDSFRFELAEEFSAYQNMDRQVQMKDLLKVRHSFPRIHLYQHQAAGKENIHQFYREQIHSDSGSDEELLTPYEEELFIDVQRALEENDILDLRANLKQVARSMPTHTYTLEDIDNYVFNRMNSGLSAQFQAEMAKNTTLAHDVQLFREIDLAMEEKDIINLRASLKEIHKSQIHTSTSIKDIENYLNNEFSANERISFESELSSNDDLLADIDLIRNIDLAMNEKDVMQLRSNLRKIAAENVSEKKTEQSFITKFKSNRLVWSAVAASLILLMGISGLMTGQSSQDELYHNYYSKYQTSGINRSATNSTDQTLSIALQKFDNQDYEAALDLLQKVVARDQKNMVGHFYSGVSLQETGKYQKAIREYETVIIDKDNLFVEQAGWYIGLCYLQTNENKKAYQQFNTIAQNKGFYQQKAMAILRKMNYSEE